MRRFAADGLSHHDPLHVRAYVLARQDTDRPTAKRVFQVLKTLQTTHETSSSLASTFWLVPRANFAGGLPGLVAKALVDEAELRQTFAVPVDAELAAWFIVDHSCPREALGPRAKSMNFQEKLKRSLAGAGAGSALAAEASDPPEPEAIPAHDKPAAAPALDTPAAARALDAASSSLGEPTPAPTVVDENGPDLKRRRVLRMMDSEEAIKPEEHEATAWETLVKKIKEAAQEGLVSPVCVAG